MISSSSSPRRSRNPADGPSSDTSKLPRTLDRPCAGGSELTCSNPAPGQNRPDFIRARSSVDLTGLLGLPVSLVRFVTTPCSPSVPQGIPCHTGPGLPLRCSERPRAYCHGRSMRPSASLTTPPLPSVAWPPSVARGLIGAVAASRQRLPNHLEKALAVNG